MRFYKLLYNFADKKQWAWSTTYKYQVSSDSLSIAFNEGLFSKSFTISRIPKCYIAILLFLMSIRRLNIHLAEHLICFLLDLQTWALLLPAKKMLQVSSSKHRHLKACLRLLLRYWKTLELLFACSL